ncbi:CocE/NonD family hydrolase [Sinosporangium siamense]|uniref:X-Pro dipeptidyl-peptidase n=1 Tax=Sinosporangium siamense TaxID=1367973 RepID=A0A919RNH0_9ACTN|nr:CocE/NonD family hydrolase [Sinosporangium siamense]GII95229.1 X-Pro dipeptidyl-peptidase [Sinosporangium siamense]
MISVDVAIPGAGGGRLPADIFLPVRLPAPVVVVRTPYGTPPLWPEAEVLADEGVAVVLQDLRGRYRADGEFVPGADESADGHAVLDWAARQSWSDGTALLYGTAYEAYAAWCAADHPSVCGIVSRQPWPGGAPAVDEELWWRTELGTGRHLRPGLYDLALARDPDLRGVLADPASWPVPLGPWPPTPSSWKPQSRRALARARKVAIPSLHLGSWYCGSATTSLRQGALARRATVLIGGWASPLTHRLQPDCALAVPEGDDPRDLAVSWLAALAAKGDPLAVTGDRLLTLGAGRWDDTSPLPPAGPTRAPVPVRPRRRRHTLRHDPRDPHPSLPHSADLAGLGDRDDVVRLTTGPPLRWHGVVSLNCRVTADAPAELVATLVHERPGGTRVRLCDGTTPLRPGAQTVVLRLAPVAVELPEGHLAHLELTVGRHPRHRAPDRPVTLAVSLDPDTALRVPRPREENP